jgi:osmotically-inducible protein OsmY
MMTLFARWFGRKYNDEQLVAHAKNALAADPRLMDVSGVSIASAKGVVSLTGTVHKSTEKERSEGVVREALRTAGLKYERILNEIKVG